MTKEYDRKVLLNRQEFIALRSVLSDWYGDDRAELEIGARSVPVQKLGSPLNKFTRFLSFKKHIMTIEVSHPAILRELNDRLKNTIIAKVNAVAGPNVCRELKAVPAGQS